MSRPPAALMSLVVPLLLVALTAPTARAAPHERFSGQAPRSTPAAPTATVASPAAAPRLGKVLTLVNRARSKARTCGGVQYDAVPQVRRNARLDRAAGKHARSMAQHDFFSHDSRDGSAPGDRISREGYRWTTYGENIAAGQASPASVVRAWLRSPGHCAIIMTRYLEIGIGYGYRAEATYQRYWVLDLASRRVRR